MKNHIGFLRPHILRFCVALAWLVFAVQQVSATVAFTVTPPAISNTYSGSITFQVTGLTNAGDTVLVQKYLVADGGSVVDATAILWQQFYLTDGQAGMVIGGVTNINMPGDTDGAANEQITAKLNPQADFSQVVSASYLYVLSSPSNHFLPQTNAFAVTNFPYAQKFTGTVVSNGVPVPYASVLVFPGSGSGGDGPGNPVGGAVANSSGVYALPVPAGPYTLVAFKPTFVASLAGSAGVVLGAGATLNTNLSLLASTATISGKVVDANNSSLGVPGLLMAAQVKSGYLAIGITDTNGNFNIGVTGNQWGISPQSAGLAFHGYVGSQDKASVNTTTGSVSGVTLTLSKGTALVYGTVNNSVGGPFSGEVAIYADDNNNGQYQSDGYTTTTGYYVTAVVGGLGDNDPWNVSVDNSSSFPNDNFSQPLFDENGGTNISAGQAVQANFTVIPATNLISGNIKHSGTNLVGLNVSAYTQDTNSYQAQVTTDSSGNYALIVGNGAWTVNVNCQGDNGSVQSILDTTNFQCPCGPTLTISNNSSTGNNLTVLPGGTGQIFGYITNTSGGGISGVTVYLNNECDGQGDSTATAGNGYYSFTVEYGMYNVSVDCGGLNSAGYQCLTNVSVTLSSASVEQNFTGQSSGGGGSTTLFGYVRDTDGDNVVGVTVYASNGTGANYSTMTDDNGYYGFNVGNGTWDVSVDCGGLTSLGYQCVSDQDVTISNDSMEQDFTVQFANSSPLQISTTYLNGGMVGGVYDQQLSATGGQMPYTWSLSPGSLALPAGLNLSTNGYITGTPLAGAIGTNYFSVRVTDNQSDTADQFLSLIVYPTVMITNVSIPNGTNGLPYSVVLGVTGGEGGYFGWALNTGSLPNGVSIGSSNFDGLIYGAPTQTGTFNFSVSAIDNTGYSFQHSYSLTILAAVVQITTASLTNATVGIPYTNQLAGSGGATPYTWTIANGSQPPPVPLTLSTAGLLAGVPVTSGTNSFIVRLTDHSSPTSLTTTHTFTLITNPKPKLSAAAKISGTKFQFLLAGAVGQNYTLQVSTNLTSTNWTSLFTTNSTTTNSFIVLDPNATNHQRFYRVLIGP